MSLVLYENRLIAMLDVLGLSSHINSQAGLLEVFEDYSQAIAYSQSEIFRVDPGRRTPTLPHGAAFDVFECAEFVFDNLVLVSKPLNPRNITYFVNGVSHVMQYFAIQEMPLRGAVAVGDYLNGGSGNVFLSTAFKALSEAEKSQNWSGCVLLQDAENVVLEALDGLDANVQSATDAIIWFPVPLHGRAEQEAWCINWVFGMSSVHLNELSQFMNEVEAKKSNTERFIQAVLRLPARHYPLPQEFFPATSATIGKCGTSYSFTFWDSMGQPSEIGCAAFVFGEHENQSFVGYNTELEHSQRRGERGWKS